MTEPLCAAAIVDHLQRMGISSIETRRDATAGVWRIRAHGGPVVHIFDDGRVVFSGLKARSLRKALGLTGQRRGCRIVPGLTPQACGSGPGVRLNDLDERHKIPVLSSQNDE